MQEWPEDIYPPYANGPGYVISGDIAKFVVSQHANQSLRVSFRWRLSHITFMAMYWSVSLFGSCTAAIQDGGRKHGAVGWEVQLHVSCQVFPQLEVLPVRLPGELLHGALPVTEANAVPLGQAGPGPSILLQLQIARRSMDWIDHSTLAFLLHLPVILVGGVAGWCSIFWHEESPDNSLASAAVLLQCWLDRAYRFTWLWGWSLKIRQLRSMAFALFPFAISWRRCPYSCNWSQFWCSRWSDQHIIRYICLFL